MNFHIAVDIGASSGRIILGHIENEKLILKQVYRFRNDFFEENGLKKWNIDELIKEIFTGLSMINYQKMNNVTLGIDTWGVDYVFVNNKGKKISNPVCYRDSRADKKFQEITDKLTKEKIYAKTGIQFQKFNTIYQLSSESQNTISDVDKVLLIPDYINYVLTGKMVTEATNASTTQLVNLASEDFDEELLKAIGLKKEQFAKIVEPGTVLGTIKEKYRREYKLPKIQIVCVGSHDTASAVAGIPAFGKNWAYISSGTWSLLGTEEKFPNTTQEAFDGNYTNERGVNHSIRFLKNIMGMWIVQRIKKENFNNFSFQGMADEAEKFLPFQQFIDINDSVFLSPKNMLLTLKNYCVGTSQKVPRELGEIMMCIYSNLALYYANEIQRIQRISRKTINNLFIVGGGCNIDLLNQLTADVTGIEVIAGPSEATAAGNIITQMLETKEVSSITAGRKLIVNSLPVKRYKPATFNSDILKKYQLFLKEKGDLND
ncbi:rhamnulokinase [Companilactobacillus sp. HBUAS56257]|uniref:rhamnulokinase n=1 Tax=Companilactobacillus sp. HBUAS56257 TaxID=3109360 RepID=UPI002FF05C52